MPVKQSAHCQPGAPARSRRGLLWLVLGSPVRRPRKTTRIESPLITMARLHCEVGRRHREDARRLSPELGSLAHSSLS